MLTESGLGGASKLPGFSKRNPSFQVDCGFIQILINKHAEINLSKTALGGINQRLFEMRSYYYLGPTDHGYIIAILSNFLNEARN